VIYRLVQARAGRRGAGVPLEKLETESMGLHADEDKNRRVAEMLLELMK